MTLIGFQATSSAVCVDEAAHIAAGLYHFKTGRLDSYNVNPPLVRLWASFPLLFTPVDIDWTHPSSPFSRSEYQFADRWINGMQEPMKRQLLMAREMMIVFFLLGAWAVHRWSTRLYGTAAGAVAVVLWAIHPDVVSYSAIVGPDLPASSFGVLCCYLFWDWMVQSKRAIPWKFAASLSLAILCKYSWCGMAVIFPAVVFLYDMHQNCGRLLAYPSDQMSRCKRCVIAFFRSFRGVLQLTVSYSLMLLLVNLCFGFDGFGKRLDSFEFMSIAAGGEDAVIGNRSNRFDSTLIGGVILPFPQEMVLGLDYLQHEFESGARCYAGGIWKDRGWWYFYLYAMAFKMPAGYWVLFVIGFVTWVCGVLRRSRSAPLEWVSLLMAVAFIALISSKTGFTHHVRYVLPSYGLLFVFASRVVISVPRLLMVTCVGGCLAGSIWFHAMNPGLSHTFFNAFAGGSNDGWRHLSFSNIDWGQSTYRLADWVIEHPEQRPMTVLFRSPLGNPGNLVADQNDVLTAIHPECLSGETPARPMASGWYLMSSFQLSLEANRFFWDKTPVEQPSPDAILFYVRESRSPGGE